MTSGDEMRSSSPPTTRVGTPILPRGGDDAVGGVLENHRLHLLYNLLVIVQGVGAEKAFDLKLLEDPDSLLGDAEGRLVTDLPHLLRVGFGAGIGEHEGTDPLGEEPHALEGDVTAHGDSAEDHAFQMQPVQEAADPFRIVMDVGLGRSTW